MHGTPAMVSEYRHTEIASCQDSTDLPTRINQLDPILHFTSRRRRLGCIERLTYSVSRLPQLFTFEVEAFRIGDCVGLCRFC